MRVVSKFLGISLLASASCLVAATSEQDSSESTYRSRSHHFGIGYAKPITMGSQNNYYEKLFSSPSGYPEFWGEFTFLSLGMGFDLGASFRTGLYQDSGKSALKNNNLDLDVNPNPGDLQEGDVDSSQKSRLTLIPFQTALNLSYSPFVSRLLIFNVWSGVSFTYVENSTQANIDSSIDQSDVVPYVNSGFNQEQVMGASISFDVSRLDPSAAYSLKVYGINGIFFTPFYQTVSTVKNSVGIYDRDVFGLMFSFETTGS